MSILSTYLEEKNNKKEKLRRYLSDFKEIFLSDNISWQEKHDLIFDPSRQSDIELLSGTTSFRHAHRQFLAEYCIRRYIESLEIICK